MVRNEAANGAGLSEEQEKWNMVVQEYNEYRKQFIDEPKIILLCLNFAKDDMIINRHFMMT